HARLRGDPGPHGHKGHRPLDGGALPHVLRRPPRHLPGRRPRPAKGGRPWPGPARTPRRHCLGNACRTLGTAPCDGGAALLALFCEPARHGRSHPVTKLQGPRLSPVSGAPPTSLVVILHGYGADGADLIGLGEAWRQVLPDALFVAPDAPTPCAGNPFGGFE